MAKPDAERLAAELAAHPDFRVLRRLDVTREWPALTGAGVSQAVVLDTETTGMDSTKDKVIELALVKFEYSRASGEIGRVLGVYDGLEDPGMPIPPESTAVHGITDAMVAGERLDEAAIESVARRRGLGDRAQRGVRSAVCGAPVAGAGVAAVGLFAARGAVGRGRHR